MDVYLNDNQISTQLAIPDFALKTQLQIEKDFASSGIILSENFTTSNLLLNEILDEVEKRLTAFINMNHGNLSQLMYQIDIPETEFTHLLNETNFERNLSYLIVKREAYKVFLRSKF